MIEIIGKPTGQQNVNAGSYSSRRIQDVIIQKTERIRETQWGERLKRGESAKSESGADERIRKRTKLEDGNIIIETYTETGLMIKTTPPDFLPVYKIA